MVSMKHALDRCLRNIYRIYTKTSVNVMLMSDMFEII